MRKWKGILSLLVVLMMMYVGITGAFADGTPQIQVSSGNVTAGETVTVNVALLNNPGINTYTLSIQYDKTKLELTDVKQADGWGGTFMYTANTETVAWQTGSDTNYSGAAIVLTFKALDTASGAADVTVSYDQGNICNLDEEDVNFSIVKGTVTVAAAPHDHQYTETVTTPATCTTEGVLTKVCSICGDTVTASIAKLDHETELIGAVEATCHSEGYTGDKVCKNCDTVIERGTTISKTAHTWGDYTVKTPATCTAEGEKTRTCTVEGCGETETAAIPKLDHTPGQSVTENTVEASCTVAGSYDTVVYCTECETEISRTTVTIPAAGHTWGEWETVTSPNCTDKGSEKRVCSVCKYEESRDLEANGHTWQDTVTIDKEATCTEDGSKSVHCTICTATKDNEVIPAKGHTWDEGEVTKEATETERGEKHFACTVCDAEKTEPIPALNEKDTPAATEKPAAPAASAPAAAGNGAKSSVPKTGDEAPIALWAMVGLFSLMGLVVVGKKKG
jgi:LPXTG-motif cell wall-anchored protein